MKPEHWGQVRDIYQQGIDTGNATLETSPPEYVKWDRNHLQNCRFVVCNENTVLGWAALSPVSERCAYAGVAEVSIYIAKQAQGKGVGTLLLNRLIQESETIGIWTLTAGIFPENRASIAIHLKCGFRIVGTREKLGALKGDWRDVMLLERRSKVVGV